MTLHYRLISPATHRLEINPKTTKAIPNVMPNNENLALSESQ